MTDERMYDEKNEDNKAYNEQSASQPVEDREYPDSYVSEENFDQSQETAFMDTTWAAEPQSNAEAYNDKAKEKKQGKNTGRIVLFVVIALLFGFGGGILASTLSANQMLNRISADIEGYLTEAGATVLYRSVETETKSSDAGIDETAVSDLCADSVVEILTESVTDYGWFGQTLSEGAGSGVIISEDGYILTCNHVVEDTEVIHVALRNGEQYEATLVGADAQTDIAVIKIEAEGLTAAVLGHSSELKVGDGVVAIGNPLGSLGGTVTSGIISALAREITIDGYTFTLLQTDAAINGGNSGGGLFNAKGELVGIVNAKTSDAEGLNFAIPIDEVQDVVDDLITYGYVSFRVTLGINMVQIDDERTAMSYRVDDLGVYVLSVEENSNADFAGLASGDRLVSIDGEEITSASQVQEIIGSHIVGDVIHIVVERNDEEIGMDVTLFGKVPDGASSEAASIQL